MIDLIYLRNYNKFGNIQLGTAVIGGGERILEGRDIAHVSLNYFRRRPSLVAARAKRLRGPILLRRDGRPVGLVIPPRAAFALVDYLCSQESEKVIVSGTNSREIRDNAVALSEKLRTGELSVDYIHSHGKLIGAWVAIQLAPKLEKAHRKWAVKWNWRPIVYYLEHPY